ncbi:MAG: hypothetical protein ABWZ98_03155, partial [Nakamurella sp.]
LMKLPMTPRKTVPSNAGAAAWVLRPSVSTATSRPEQPMPGAGHQDRTGGRWSPDAAAAFRRAEAAGTDVPLSGTPGLVERS